MHPARRQLFETSTGGEDARARRLEGPGDRAPRFAPARIEPCRPSNAGARHGAPAKPSTNSRGPGLGRLRRPRRPAGSTARPRTLRPRRIQIHVHRAPGSARVMRGKLVEAQPRKDAYRRTRGGCESRGRTIPDVRAPPGRWPKSPPSNTPRSCVDSATRSYVWPPGAVVLAHLSPLSEHYTWKNQRGMHRSCPGRRDQGRASESAVSRRR